MHQVIDHFVRSTRGKSALAELTEVRTARFTAPLTPGDTLSLTCTLKPGTTANWWSGPSA
ncbi:hypothetical protein [Streptomyces sp. NPDC085540]|uniref:hypothetical protein n=1 Tax=Streptomyces sp. NPDC085540 TaxID=3365730 RepID=UPI0037D16627